MKENLVAKKINPYRDSELEAHLQKKYLEFQQRFRETARHYAERGLPEETGDSLNHYTDEITASFQELIDEIDKRIQARASIVNVKIEKQLVEKRQRKIQFQIDALTKRNGNSILTLGGHQNRYIKLRVTGIALFVILIFGSDVAFNTLAFQGTLREIVGFSLVIACALSLSTTLAPHFIIDYAMKARTVMAKRAIWIGSTCVAIALFTCLAIFRVQFLKEAVSPFIAILLFVMTNMIYMVVTGALWYKLFPTWEEFKMQNQFDEREEEKATAKRQIIALESEYNQLDDSLATSLIDKGGKYYYAASLEREVISEYEKTIALFKSTIIFCRGSKAPDCLGDSFPMLRTNYQTQNSKP